MSPYDKDPILNKARKLDATIETMINAYNTEYRLYTDMPELEQFR